MFNTKVAIFILIVFSFAAYAQIKDSLIAVRIAPNFTLENIDGDFTELNEFIGKGPIILSFFASICKPCRDQTKAFSKIYNKFKEKGLTLIAIATDDVKTVAKVKPYIKSMGYDFTVLYDTEGRVSRLYYAQLVPFSVLINQEGLIIYSHMGYMWGDEIEVDRIIKNLLNE